jgi:cytochrome P450
MTKPLPTASPQTGLRALQAMLRERHPLAAMQVFHRELGDAFRIQLPGFTPVVLAGPQAAHFVLVEQRSELRWRNENDPVTDLLRHGVLVEDGEEHDRLRQAMTPALHRRLLEGYLEAMRANTQRVLAGWPEHGVVDMLVEMRKAALLILLDTLYGVDFAPHLERLWKPILKDIQYISPGLWMLWRSVPRIGFKGPRQRLDDFLYAVIRARRADLGAGAEARLDLVGLLIEAGLDDDLIRDQLLTMLIAGHDTSTALLSWSLYLLGSHPEAMKQAREEVLAALGAGAEITFEALRAMPYLEMVMRAALRLYPPIHLGSRVAARDLEYDGFHIPAGERVIYSIYLTQRHPNDWGRPDEFIPERHAPGASPTPYSWLAFGGGPRNCIGAAYGQVEVKVVLATILRNFELEMVEKNVHPHMGATLEPRPGVRMRVKRI